MPGFLTKHSAVQRIHSGLTCIKLFTFAVNLTLNTAIQTFGKTVRLRMMYCQTMFAPKE